MAKELGDSVLKMRKGGVLEQPVLEITLHIRESALAMKTWEIQTALARKKPLTKQETATKIPRPTKTVTTKSLYQKV